MQSIPTVQIHGKDYVTVATRLQLVREQGAKLEIVSSEPLQCGDRWLWRVTMLIDGTQFVGCAEVKLDAKSGPDKTNPWECAETSACGRALGFAGYGAIESIASADEVVRAMAERESPASVEQIGRIRRGCQLLGKEEPDVTVLTVSAANDLIEQLTVEYRQVKKAS